MEKWNDIAFIKDRLMRQLPGISAQERMLGRVVPLPDEIPLNARASAVLCLLMPVAGELNVLFIKRTEDGRAHSGQISFPGGRKENQDADLIATALRETQEEVGIMSSDIEILGPLTQLYIPVSNFQVYPFVGYCNHRPSYTLSVREVAATIEIPLSHLLTPQNKRITEVRPSAAPQLLMKVPAYHIDNGQVIWGATAMILSELEVALQGLDILPDQLSLS